MSDKFKPVIIEAETDIRNMLADAKRDRSELNPLSGSKYVVSIVTTRNNPDGTMRIQNNVIVLTATSKDDATGQAVNDIDLVGEKLQIFSVLVVGPDQLT